MNARSLLVVCLIGTAVFSSRPSDACAPQMCVGGQFLPAQGAVIPANTPAIWWWPDRPNGTPDTALPIHGGSFDLMLVDQGNEELLPVHSEPGPAFGGLFLVPKDPMPAERTIRVRGVSYCPNDTGLLDETATSAEFETTQPADFPTVLGTLVATPQEIGPLTLADASGSCFSTVEAAIVRISLQYASEAMPWKDVFAFETRIDGKPWKPSHFLAREPIIGSSWEGRGQDLAFAICDVPPFSYPAVEPLKPGSHQVTMRAWIPGSNTLLETPGITISLSCDDADAGNEDAGKEDAGNEDAGDVSFDVEPDVSSDVPPEIDSDAGADTASDAVVESASDSATDSGADTTNAESSTTDDSDGCSCSMVGRAAPTGVVWVSLWLLGLGIWRFRHRCHR